MSNLKIVRAQDKHSGEIATMFSHLHELHTGMDPFIFKPIDNIDSISADIRDKIISKSRLFLLAYIDDELCGYLEASFGITNESELFSSRKISKLENLFVYPSKRRNGCATALFNAFLDFAEERGFAEHIELDVMSENKQAIAFYEKLGFTPYKSIFKRGK